MIKKILIVVILSVLLLLSCDLATTESEDQTTGLLSVVYNDVVLQNGGTLDLGSKISTAADHTSTYTFSLKNIGTTAVALTGSASVFTLSGTNVSNFAVSVPSATSLEPNESTNFTLTFTHPQYEVNGTKSVKLTVPNDGDRICEFTASLTGTAEPEIAVDYSTDSGLTFADYPSTTGPILDMNSAPNQNYITIKNTGWGILNIPSMSFVGTTHLAKWDFTESDGAPLSYPYVIQATPLECVIRYLWATTGDEENCTLDISSNDSDEADFIINLEGRS